MTGKESRLNTKKKNKKRKKKRKKERKKKKLLALHRNNRIYIFRLQYHSCEERWRESWYTSGTFWRYEMQ